MEEVTELTDDQKLARRVEATFRNYMHFPDEEAYTITTLWVLHAHLRKPDGQFAPYITPRLYFGSAEPGAGKSLATQLTVLMAGGRMIGDPTAPGLTTMLNIDAMVPGLDEIDLLFGNSARSHASIRTILNMGYKRNGGSIIRERGGEVDWQEVFGPIVMNGKNLRRFETHESFNALRSRSLIIPLTKKGAGVKLARYRSSKHEAGIRQLAAELRAWGKASQRYITRIDVEEIIPQEIDDRDWELWEVLFQLAEYLGGSWPERVMRAIRSHVLGEQFVREVEQVDPYDELYEAVRGMFGDDEDFLPTVEILERIDGMEEPPQLRSEWTSDTAKAMGLRNGLRESGVDKVRVQKNGEQYWGYTRMAFGLGPLKTERAVRRRTRTKPQLISTAATEDAA
jgi:hypothetical protein